MIKNVKVAIQTTKQMSNALMAAYTFVFYTLLLKDDDF